MSQPYAQYPSGIPQGTEVPLDQPLYGAGFGASVKRFFTKYATFSGRASRSEYWWSTLFNVIVTSVLYFATMALAAGSIDQTTGEMGGGALVGFGLLGLYFLAVLVPSIAVSVRRLHDGNYSGWFYLLSLIPMVGGIILLVFMVLPSNPQGARFDKDGGAAAGYGQPSFAGQGYGQPQA